MKLTSLDDEFYNRHDSPGYKSLLPWLVDTRMIRRPNKGTVACGYCNNIVNSGHNIIPCWDRNSSRTTRRNDKC